MMLTIKLERKPKGWDLKIGECETKNYSSLFKAAKALMNYAKGQGI